jgi:CBS domain-containing protein
MDTNLHLIHEENPILLVDKLLRWQDVTHLMVENDAHELTGIVSLQQTEKVNETEKCTKAIKEVMLTDFMTTTVETEAFSAYQLVKVYKVNILPVLSDKKIIGIVQISDFDQFK